MIFKDKDYYSIVKKFYEMGIYTSEDVKIFVLARDITEEQYKEITGEEYTD